MTDNSDLIKHVACFWYLRCDDGDFMAVLYQNKDGLWEAIFRDRKYESGKTNDRPFGNSEAFGREKMEDAFDKSFKAMADHAKKKFEKVKVEGDFLKFVQLLSKYSNTKL